ncbi:MAG: RsfS/YbeB/iojap family protein, partial [Myxococcota bacterium]
EVRRKAKSDLEIPCAGVEGLPVGRWVLVDFESVVVHIFDGPLRPFYNLDGLWADAPRLATPAGADDDLGMPVFPEPFSA